MLEVNQDLWTVLTEALASITAFILKMLELGVSQVEVLKFMLEFDQTCNDWPQSDQGVAPTWEWGEVDDLKNAFC